MSSAFSLDRALTLYVARPLRTFLGLGQRHPARLPILMYHRVADDPEPGVRPYLRLAIGPGRFAEHLDFLKGRGLRGVSLEAALQIAETQPAELHRFVAITFDDGYQDFLEAAWPALRKNDFTATVYLPTAHIGNQRRTFRGYPCLTWSEVRELRKNGIQFGSHTINHPVLYRSKWDTIRTELAESRATLEHELGEPVRAFAYPYAYPQEDACFTSRLASLLKETGYTNNVTTCIGRWDGRSERHSLPRLPLNSADDVRLLQAKVLGDYDWMSKPQQLFRRLKCLSCRRARARVDAD